MRHKHIFFTAKIKILGTDGVSSNPYNLLENIADPCNEAILDILHFIFVLVYFGEILQC
jgi:hypothetical protein